MGEDPVAVVKSAYEAFGRGDVPTVLGLIDRYAEWVESTAAGLSSRGVHIGPADVAEHVFAMVPVDWAEFTLVPEDFFRDGQTVILRGRLKAKAKATGRTMDAPFVHIFTVSDGKIMKLTNHHDTALWLEALGR